MHATITLTSRYNRQVNGSYEVIQGHTSTPNTSTRVVMHTVTGEPNYVKLISHLRYVNYKTHEQVGRCEDVASKVTKSIVIFGLECSALGVVYSYICIDIFLIYYDKKQGLSEIYNRFSLPSLTHTHTQTHTHTHTHTH